MLNISSLSGTRFVYSGTFLSILSLRYSLRQRRQVSNPRKLLTNRILKSPPYVAAEAWGLPTKLT
jgi:hypothetical protein